MDRFRARGFVFDLDGTLVDNIPLHMDSFARFSERHGLPPLTEELRARINGLRNRDIFPLLLGRPLEAPELARFSEEKEDLYRDLARGRLTPRRGLLPLLDALERRALPVAIATSAPAENVRFTLAELGLAGRLTAVVRSDEVARGKPHPDVFLRAARLIEIDPADCLAFEDAPMGVLAARAAGMSCVAVGLTHPPATFTGHDAVPDAILGDFQEYLETHGAWLLHGGRPQA